jgi:hypothetical protein
MSESMLMWMEISFNIAYLVVIWGLVIAMIRRQPQVPAGNQRLTRLIIWAFALLALGDSGHVGFRVLAFALGNLETTFSVFGLQLGLVGLGALSTAITVTLFYVLILMAWHERFKQPYGWFGYLLFAAAVLRFLVMILPGNLWNSPVPPQPMSIYRNFFLTVLGLGSAYLILRDSLATKDRAFTWIGLMIVVSYALYIPVILLVQVYPLVGMLMIPKTIAYVVVGFIAYFSLFKAPADSQIMMETSRA